MSSTPSSPHQGCGKHSGCHLATGDTECGWPPCVRIGCHTQSSQPHQDYEDCSGCTDPRSEGTHQSHTKQHPCPPGGDPDCGYCFPTQSSSEKRQFAGASYVRPHEELFSHRNKKCACFVAPHPNTEQEEMPQRIKNAYELGAQTERARLRKLVEEKRNNENDGPIRFALFGILSLLEE